MSSSSRLKFKFANEPEEFEQIHGLNYQTFVEEIPQHQPNPERRLVDKFHSENAYLIGLQDGQLAGMLAIRDKRPFSLSLKLPDLEALLPPHQRPVEIRLLAVGQGHRHARVFQGLIQSLAAYLDSSDYDLAMISGTTRQIGLYEQLGFVPFGPLVGEPAAQFQPMYATLSEFQGLKRRSKAISRARAMAAPARF
jgi:hypothetical protein